MRPLRVVCVLLVLALIGLGAVAGPDGVRFGDCANGYECETGPDGAPFPPDAVTGHTSFARFVRSWASDAAAAPLHEKGVKFPSTPLDDALRRAGPPPGYAASGSSDGTRVRQAECVVWANGYPLDQRPSAEGHAWGTRNAFPSDEDETIRGLVGPGGGGAGDAGYQDYDLDRLVGSCVPDLMSAGPPPAGSVGLATDFATVAGYYADHWPGGVNHGSLAVVVEKGDCSPEDGANFRFRGHLDFVDPNNVYHEVQEYDYECPMSGPGNLLPQATGMFGLGEYGDHVKDHFPWTYTDAHNTDSCNLYQTPLETEDWTDLGHKCNGTWQDTVTERMWVTRTHGPVYDAHLGQLYTFALQVDTCAGLNIFEGLPLPAHGPGDPALGASNNYGSGSVVVRYPIAENPVEWNEPLQAVVTSVRPSQVVEDPFAHVCTDGSSFSFDDTLRTRVRHTGMPAGQGEEELLRGNALDFDPNSPSFATHRWHCRANALAWPFQDYPAGPPPVGDDCYPEDHRAAAIDIYVFDVDPTGGLFVVHANALTGENAYTTEGVLTGPGAAQPPVSEEPLPSPPAVFPLVPAADGEHHAAPYSATRTYVGGNLDTNRFVQAGCNSDQNVGSARFCIQGPGTLTLRVDDPSLYPFGVHYVVQDAHGQRLASDNRCARSFTVPVPAEAWWVTVLVNPYYGCYGVPSEGTITVELV